MKKYLSFFLITILCCMLGACKTSNDDRWRSDIVFHRSGIVWSNSLDTLDSCSKYAYALLSIYGGNRTGVTADELKEKNKKFDSDISSTVDIIYNAIDELGNEKIAEEIVLGYYTCFVTLKNGMEGRFAPCVVTSEILVKTTRALAAGRRKEDLISEWHKMNPDMPGPTVIIHAMYDLFKKEGNKLDKLHDDSARRLWSCFRQVDRQKKN